MDFPLGPLEGPFAGVCSWGVRDASSLGCFDAGGGVDVCGVAFCTLIVGVTLPSAFFVVVAEPRLEFGPEGGGDFNLGDIGHCGVVSPLALVLLFALDALVASPVPPVCSAGTFAADNARCMAAAEGCVEMGVVRGCGLLSLRMGDVFLDVRGLVPAEAEDVVTKPPDKRFRNGGTAAAMDVGVCCVAGFRVSLVLRRGAELLAVVVLAESGVSAWPAEAELAPERSSSGLLLAMVVIGVEEERVRGGELFAHHPRRRSGHAPCFKGVRVGVCGAGVARMFTTMIGFQFEIPCSWPGPTAEHAAPAKKAAGSIALMNGRIAPGRNEKTGGARVSRSNGGVSGSDAGGCVSQ